MFAGTSPARGTRVARRAGAAAAALLVMSIMVPRAHALSPGASDSAAWRVAADLVGTVTDSATGQPLSSAEVTVMQGRTVVFNTTADHFGHYRAHDLAPGSYTVTARMLGFRAASRQVTVGASTADIHVDLALSSVALTLSAISVSAAVPVAVDVRTGDQRFKQEAYHGSPSNTTSQIIQQSIAGAVRAPTGEVHIRGQHAEYTFYVDGVPVPAGISGSLNELFDPSVVDQIDFKTGGWDAEYGNKNAAVINVQTRIPTGGFHANLSAYTGSFNTDGESVNASTNTGPWGFFGSFARQSTDMRREPVMFDTATYRPINFHNHGTDYFGFAKAQYAPTATDRVTLEGNLSTTRFQVPYDSAGGQVQNDVERDMNGFLNLGYRHRFGGLEYAGGGSGATEPRVPELFVGLFARTGSLRYTPGAHDSAQFVFYPDTLTAYTLRENRNFTTLGVKADYSVHPARELELRFGTQTQYTTGHETFVATTNSGAFGPASSSGLAGYDVGVYAQTAYAPIERFELRTGVRYDAHHAPFAGTQTQISPRIRLNFFPSPATTFYLYYGRLFVPTNVEDLRAITSVAQRGVVAAPTLPERDNFYEAALVHRFPFGLVSKLSAFHKESTPGIDDNTVPGSAIVTSVNIARVRVTGIETAQEFSPRGSPLSGYLNLALDHAYGHGPITGGFFASRAPQGYFDLDHDQRLSGTASVTYAPNRFYVSATGTYGSGLTNGVDPASCGCRYGTGLLDFNPGIKVRPNFIMDASAGYSFQVGRTLVRPELYVDNVFDRHYLLKGAFFSGASVGRPRTVQLRVTVGE